VKLRVIMTEWSGEGDIEIQKALTYGEPITGDMRPDGRSELVLGALRDAERLAAA
jgi:hypothetical protein